MQYSATHPYPHLHYQGDVDQGDLDKLHAMYRTFVRCREACAGPEGASTAVLTMSSPGGSYREGLAMADYLRANHIATVVENGNVCYSACAFAFLGGSGYSSSDRVGTYIDRVVEPGAILGFHAPYFNDTDMIAVLQERAPSYVTGLVRDDLALMVGELVRWNVDPLVLQQMVNKGPSEGYEVLDANDYYLARIGLPQSPSPSWISSIPDAVRNACMRLLAIHEKATPLDMLYRFDMPFEPIGTDDFGNTLSGYRLGTEVLSLGSCAATDASIATGADLEISLYSTPGIDGNADSMLSFFNRQEGWSSAGSGASATDRIFQKGPMNHFFLPVGVPAKGLMPSGEFAIISDRFLSIRQPVLPPLPEGFVVSVDTPTARVANFGDLWIFQQTGNWQLFEVGQKLAGPGVTVSYESASETSFVREGTYVGSPGQFSWLGFSANGANLLVRMELLKSDGVPATQEELNMIRTVQCSISFEGAALSCG